MNQEFRLLKNQESRIRPSIFEFYIASFFIDKMYFLKKIKLGYENSHIRNTFPEGFSKKATLRHFPKFIGKHLCW